MKTARSIPIDLLVENVMFIQRTQKQSPIKKMQGQVDTHKYGCIRPTKQLFLLRLRRLHNQYKHSLLTFRKKGETTTNCRRIPIEVDHRHWWFSTTSTSDPHQERKILLSPITGRLRSCENRYRGKSHNHIDGRSKFSQPGRAVATSHTFKSSYFDGN